MTATASKNTAKSEKKQLIQAVACASFTPNVNYRRQKNMTKFVTFEIPRPEKWIAGTHICYVVAPEGTTLEEAIEKARVRIDLLK